MLTIAFREKRKAFLAFLIPLVLAVIAGIIAPASYQAEMTLMVRTGPEYLPPTDGSAAAPSTTKQEQINSEIEILGSRYVAEQAINRVGLGRIYPSLGQQAHNSSSAIDKAVKRFDHDLDVQVVKLSNVISVSFKHPDADVAKDVLSAVLTAFQERHEAAFSSNQMEAYQRNIDEDMAELSKLSQQREAIRNKNGAFDVATQRANYLGQLKDAQSHLQELTDRMSALTARIEYLRNIRKRDPSMITTSSGNNDEMAYVQNALSDLKRTEAALLGQYAPDHPKVTAVHAEIVGLENRIAALGEQEIELDAAELAPSQGQAASYREQIAALTDRLKELEGADADLHAIDAKITSIDDNLRATRGRFEQARVMDDMNRTSSATSVNEIQPPVTSRQPTKPSLAKFIALGVLIGLIAASAIIVFQIATNNTLVTAESVERVLGLPVLVTVPKLAHPPLSTARPDE